MALWSAYIIELGAIRISQRIAILAVGRQDRFGADTSIVNAARSLCLRTGLAQWTVAALMLLLVSWTTYVHINQPLIGAGIEFHAIIVFLKTSSYILVHGDLRLAYLCPAVDRPVDHMSIRSQPPYPLNATVLNLIYFWVSPTLVYQTSYPRSQKPKLRIILQQTCEAACLCILIWICWTHCASPLLENLSESIRLRETVAALRSVLKLSLACMVIWIAGSFALFHSVLNALAEATSFEDRVFYQDWWNAASLQEYWRLWNKPVHHFMRRHIYSPMMKSGYSALQASTAVFFVSAALHELAVGVAIHSFRGVAFLEIMAQVPLIEITKGIQSRTGDKGPTINNYLFWIIFTVIGHPVALCSYYSAWKSTRK
ncbi:O-acyltransferase-like protein [Apiospora arundinis]